MSPVDPSGAKRDGLSAGNSMPSAKPVLIYFDPHTAGHRKEYLAFHLRACEAMGISLKAYVPRSLWQDACSLAQIDVRLGELGADLNIPIDSFRQKYATLAHVVDIERGGGNYLLYFPMIDEYLLPILLVHASRAGLGMPWSGIFFRNSFDYLYDEWSDPKRYVKSLLRLAVLHAAQRTGMVELLTMNEGWPTRLSVPVTWQPDAMSSLDVMAENIRGDQCWPVPTRAIPKRRVSLLAFGAMAPRKGILEVTHAMEALTDEELCEIDLHLLGRFDSGYRAAVEASTARLTARGALVEIEDDFVSEVHLHDALCRCNFVLAPYVNHIASSGVVGIAAQYGRPVLAQSTYQVGEEVRRNGLGLAVNCRNRNALINALRQLLEGKVKVTAEMRAYCDRKNARSATAAFEAFLSRRFGNFLQARAECRT